MADSNAQTDFEVLERALHWESAGRRPWRSYGASGTLHMLALLLSVLLTSGVEKAVKQVDKTPVAHISYEPGEVRSPRPKKPIVTALVAPLPQTREISDAPKREQTEVKVDIGAVRLTFADDSRHQLPRVVQDQQGMLALLDRKDNTIARYLVQPPDWEAEERIEDVSRNLRILMDPPGDWAVFQNLARKQGIDLSQYQASALFDDAFRHCLKKAILAKASSEPGGSGRVSSARLGIAASQPCGIEVLEVSFAAR